MAPKKQAAAPVKRMLSPRDVEAEYSIRKGTLYNMLKAGLPSVRVNGRAGHRGARLIDRNDLETFLAARKEVMA